MKIARGLGRVSLFLLLALVCFRSPIMGMSAADEKPSLADPTKDRVGSGKVPAGLSSGDWQDIRRQIIRYRHRIQSSPGEPFRAVNPGQQLRASFSRDGMWVEPIEGNWGWGLRPERVGSKELSGPPARDWAEDNRVYTRWNESLTEWVENGERGLEQGFVLAKRPRGMKNGQPSVLALAVRGDLSARANPGGERVDFQDREGRIRLTYGELKVIDSGGAQVPARLEGNKSSVRIVIDDRQAAYPLTVDPLIQQQAYLKASNTDAVDNFGNSVTISGDTVVVGAPLEDSNATGVNGNGADNSATGAGAAYVFIRSNGVWTQQAYLKASNTGAGDYFGWSVAISGDTVVVGAPNESSNATGVNGNGADNSTFFAGAAYVFIRSNGFWTQQAYLKASNTGVGDLFGWSVAISGDTVVVGADFEFSNATGAAYVFIRNSGVWAQQAYLKAFNTSAGDSFGTSVAISGDTVIVGAVGEASNATGVNGNGADNSAAGSGAAYVFIRINGAWYQQAYLKASNTGAGDNFGYSVAISGDTVVVGAVGESSNATGVNGNGADNSALNAGAGYVFIRSSGVWTQQAYLKASNTGAGDHFGTSVAISGDTVMVGAIGEASNAAGVNGNQSDNSASYAGAAYVFVRSDGTWTQQAYLKASNTDAADEFGYSVTISEDTVVVGAPYEASNATGVNGNEADQSALNAGAAYIFTIKWPIYLPIILR